ncbi:MAG: tRNA threonylcarbamoyladenosine biosynthesis protein TsaB [Eubacteriales bacterium SKADARSKE-1]|nr:tRNA threonylcarbamoyladenosine biosynthesis protein TsaB [Eubacteriales bacterium SKADARSKE-1]
MRILALDSSAKSASVAILEDKKVLGEFYINVGLTHSQTLLPMVKSLLENTKIDLYTIDCFAVSAGPGSFTGVRIGVSAVKGMALALKKPCVSVSTLESLAYNVINENCIVCAVMDARCNQVYNAIFKIENGKITRLTPDRAISIDELYIELSKYNEKIILVGDGADLCYNKKVCNLSLCVANESFKCQTAKSVAYVGRDLFLNGEAVPAANLVPTYLRRPQAERVLCEKRGISL